MLRSVVICPDSDLVDKLEPAVAETKELSVNRVLTQYPSAIDLVRTLRAHAPEVIFLSFESLDKAQAVVKQLESEAGGAIQIIAINRDCDARILRETMRLGVREFISAPFEHQALMESIGQVKTLLARSPVVHDATTQIFSFLPSKAGVGTSTLALNVSAALARRPDMHVLVSDFDLNSGMMRFMLNLKNENSVLHAVEHSTHIDENLWPQLVTPIGNLEILHAGRLNPNLRIEAAQIRHLIDFMRRNYQALCFDLSGNLEKYSIDLMQESKRVILVVTPEMASLHLAREKLSFLRGFDLENRIIAVLNRCPKKPAFSKDQVEELLGMPVTSTFPNDYHGCNRAVTAAKPIDADSELGKSFAEFAQNLIERRPVIVGPETKKKFLQFFSVADRALVQTRK